jgi:Spy/CpxP family protein refolding chaperone
MKRIINIAAAVALMLGTIIPAAAQNNSRPEGQSWREKVKAEKIAWITSRMDLTPAEAQVFWPLYNELEKYRQECFSESMKAFHALNKALSGNSPESEISALTDKYVSTLGKSEVIEKEYIAKFSKVLSPSKLAKLLIAEEQFRRSQIHKLNQGGSRPGPQGGPFQGNKDQKKMN